MCASLEAKVQEEYFQLLEESDDFIKNSVGNRSHCGKTPERGVSVAWRERCAQHLGKLASLTRLGGQDSFHGFELYKLGPE